MTPLTTEQQLEMRNLTLAIDSVLRFSSNVHMAISATVSVICTTAVRMPPEVRGDIRKMADQLLRILEVVGDLPPEEAIAALGAIEPKGFHAQDFIRRQ